MLLRLAKFDVKFSQPKNQRRTTGDGEDWRRPEQYYSGFGAMCVGLGTYHPKIAAALQWIIIVFWFLHNPHNPHSSLSPKEEIGDEGNLRQRIGVEWKTQTFGFR